MESLKGPALEIVRALRFSKPEAKSDEFLDAINRAFGSPESGEDLYFSFCLMQQKSGVKRLEPFLTRVVQKGGIMAKDMDRVRIEQLFRGAVNAKLLLLQLCLKERRNQPPNFLDLLSEIRAEEEYERSRHKVRPHVRQVGAQEDVEADSVPVQSLKAELKTLKVEMAELAEKPRGNADEVKPLLLSSVHQRCKDSASEVTALKKDVNRMKQKVKNLTEKDSESVILAASAKVDTPKYYLGADPKLPSTKDGGDFFCYQCGEDGHIATKCTLPENEKKVIRKLIFSLHRTNKNSQNPYNHDTLDKERHCSVRKQAVNAIGTVSVPEGLIGPTPTAQIRINGHPCTALLDSGSQVTIIFEDWYEQHLSYVPIHQVSGLAIWGLSSSSYPYRGYIVVDVQFPKEYTGAPETLSVLALVCPGPKTPDQTPVILGTNANLFKRPASLCTETAGVRLTRVLGADSGTDVSVPISNRKGVTAECGNENVGHVKWMGPGCLVMAPQQTRCVSCKVDLWCQYAMA
uniref:CCHC-type domain-containing protein n=1 Tax=Pygocentrus nattereri TaxID=42514 RepID=A0A3B4DH60_PYGNA